MPTPQHSRIKPQALRAGDTIGIIAPASDLKGDLLDAGCEQLRRRGYQTVYLESILERDLYFAGTVERRTRELEDMFARDDIRAIFCARGGYGSNYVMDAMRPSTVLSHPKIFAGYSDLTPLLTAFCDTAEFVTFHAPMITKDFALDDGVDWPSFDAAFGGQQSWEIVDSGAHGVVDGSAEGIMYGGCLSLLVATIGTPHEIRTRGTILFIEDVNTKPYQIDRMLMHLKLAGKFEGVRGIIFGEMLDCRQNAQQAYSLEEVVLRIIGKLGIPVAFGLRSGHASRRNITLPIGIQAALDVRGSQVRLNFLEAATTP